MRLEAHYLKRRIGRKFFDSFVLYPNRGIQIGSMREIFFFLPYRWRRGVCSREFRIGHLSKVPLSSPRPSIRRKHFRESTWRKYLKISATVAGTKQKQDASIFTQNLRRTVRCKDRVALSRLVKFAARIVLS